MNSVTIEVTLQFTDSHRNMSPFVDSRFRSRIAAAVSSFLSGRPPVHVPYYNYTSDTATLEIFENSRNSAAQSALEFQTRILEEEFCVFTLPDNEANNGALCVYQAHALTTQTLASDSTTLLTTKSVTSGSVVGGADGTVLSDSSSTAVPTAVVIVITVVALVVVMLGIAYRRFRNRKRNASSISGSELPDSSKFIDSAYDGLQPHVLTSNSDFHKIGSLSMGLHLDGALRGVTPSGSHISTLPVIEEPTTTEM